MWNIADLEHISLSMWNATEEIAYDGWLLRFAGGYSGRANSVQTYGKSSLPLIEKITYCEAMYAQRHIPILFKLTQATQPTNLDAFLREQGYILRNTTSVQLLDIADTSFGIDSQFEVLVGNAQSGVFSPQITNWMEQAQHIKGFSPKDDASHRSILARLTLPTCYGAIHDVAGQVVGIGICVYNPQHRIAGIFDIGVHSDYRRNGHGRKLTMSLIAWAKEQGAGTIYLQVEAGNDKAFRLYESLGFIERYQYWYLRKP